MTLLLGEASLLRPCCSRARLLGISLVEIGEGALASSLLAVLQAWSTGHTDNSTSGFQPQTVQKPTLFESLSNLLQSSKQRQLSDASLAQELKSMLTKWTREKGQEPSEQGARVVALADNPGQQAPPNPTKRSRETPFSSKGSAGKGVKAKGKGKSSPKTDGAGAHPRKKEREKEKEVEAKKTPTLRSHPLWVSWLPNGPRRLNFQN